MIVFQIKKMHPYFYSFCCILFVCCHFISSNADLFIKKCKKDDNNCLKHLVQSMIILVAEGDPQYGLHPLDPLEITHIDSSSSNLQLNLNDITVTGLKGCVAKKVKYNMEKSSLFMKLMCSVDLNGDYEMKGRLLFLPIEGNGKIHTTLRKAIFGVDSMLSHVVDDKGRNHLNIVDWSHSYDLKDQADLYFDNLFNGNEVLGKAAQDVIANNSNEIILEVGSPIVKTIISKVVESVQQLYHSIPLEDLIID